MSVAARITLCNDDDNDYEENKGKRYLKTTGLFTPQIGQCINNSTPNQRCHKSNTSHNERYRG